MSTKLTSEIIGYKTTGSFRFWCQHVLPLVYDDSLSYYELLCKVVNYLNDVISNVDALKDATVDLIDAFNELKDYVDNYFENLDVQEEINNKLDEMVQDGTLTHIIEFIFTSLKNWSEPAEFLEAYRDEVRKNVASYLLYEYGSNCVVDNPVAESQKVCWKYNTNLGYMGLFGRYLKFKYDDVQETPDGNLPVAYADCSQFTSLITKCISYQNSPYEYAFNTTPIDKEVLYRKALESGSIADKPYTFDFLNDVNTDTMAYIHNKVGISLLHISEMTSEDVAPTTHDLDKLETGDIIYRGVSGSTHFYGINHCGVFIKDLNELATANGVPQGVKFKTPDGRTSSVGYVAEFAGSLGDNNYTDCLRLTPIEDWFDYHISQYDWVNCYMGKPVSCALTSNKAYSELTSEIKCYDFDMYVTQERGADGKYIPVKMIPKIAGGWIIKEGEDLNDFTIDGIYQCTTTAVKETLLNAPTGSAYDNFNMICTGFNKDTNYGVQIIFGNSATHYQYACMRTKATNWSPWVNICMLTDTSDNVGVKEAISGINNVNSIPAGGYKDVTVALGHTFITAPKVFAQLEVMESETACNLTATVINGSITTTQFKLRIFNHGNSAANGHVRWIAETVLQKA